MLKKSTLVIAAVLAIVMIAGAQGPRRITLGDWPEQRGPNRDGVSRETGLIDRWALTARTFSGGFHMAAVRRRS